MGSDFPGPSPKASLTIYLDSQGKGNRHRIFEVYWNQEVKETLILSPKCYCSYCGRERVYGGQVMIRRVRSIGSDLTVGPVVIYMAPT